MWKIPYYAPKRWLILKKHEEGKREKSYFDCFFFFYTLDIFRGTVTPLSFRGNPPSQLILITSSQKKNNKKTNLFQDENRQSIPNEGTVNLQKNWSHKPHKDLYTLAWLQQCTLSETACGQIELLNINTYGGIEMLVPWQVW